MRRRRILPKTSIARAAGGDPDARLVALRSEYETLVAFVNGPASDDEAAAAVDREDEIEREITRTPARSISGMLVKLWLAKHMVDIGRRTDNLNAVLFDGMERDLRAMGGSHA